MKEGLTEMRIGTVVAVTGELSEIVKIGDRAVGGTRDPQRILTRTLD
jgi:hypothetical protein